MSCMKLPEPTISETIYKIHTALDDIRVVRACSAVQLDPEVLTHRLDHVAAALGDVQEDLRQLTQVAKRRACKCEDKS